MKTFFNKIRRWLSKPQRIYEWQFSRRFWNLTGKWQRLKFSVTTRIFGLRSWDVSQRQSFFIGLEITKTIFWQVAWAIVLVVILGVVNHFLAPYIAMIHFLPQMDAEAINSFMGIVAQVAGVFLGLYFTAISVVASTVYARVPGEIRELLTKEKVGNLYIRAVALTVAVASLLLAKAGIGFSISILDVLLAILLILMAIFSFVRLGMRIFYFFDFTELSKQLDSELVHWSRSATTSGFRFYDPTFQAHYQKQAERALRTYGGVVILAIEDKHFDGRALAELMARPLILLQVYAKNKSSIPSDSQWFRKVYHHRNWLTTNSDEVSMALRSGTSLQPELVPDLLWFEKYVMKMNGDVVKALIERNDLASAGAVVDSMQRTQFALAEYLAIDEAFYLFAGIRSQIEDVMLVEELTPDKEETQLARLGLIDVYCLGVISILLGLSKTLGKTGSESIVHQMKGIGWKKRKSIYIDLAPREVTVQLEYLQEHLIFEHEVEGEFISPPWYQEQIAAQGMVRFIERAVQELVKHCEDIFAGETERLISERKYLNATQVIQRGLEACDKSIHHLEVINKAFEGISTLRRVKDIPWPNLAHDELKNRVLAVRERLISGFAKSSIELAKMPSKKNWPDYFGQCYSVMAEECNSSMAQKNETLFGRVFPAFFYAALAASDRLRSELAGRSDRDALVYMSEPIEDLLHVSGYALIYSELDAKKYWEVVKGLWDKYLSNRNNPKEIVEFIVNTVNFRQSIFAILPRATLRTGWQQKLEKRLRDGKILDEIGDYAPVLGRHPSAPKHASKIIQVIARGTMGTIFSDGQDVFLATYIANRPEANGLKLPHSAQSFFDSLARLEAKDAHNDEETE